jgi:hypothetical protein
MWVRPSRELFHGNLCGATKTTPIIRGIYRSPATSTGARQTAFATGRIEAGDIRGPWIFDDLQKAFDALRWNMAEFPTVTNGEYKEVTGGTVSEMETAWASASWQSGKQEHFDNEHGGC